MVEAGCQVKRQTFFHFFFDLELLGIVATLFFLDELCKVFATLSYVKFLRYSLKPRCARGCKKALYDVDVYDLVRMGGFDPSHVLCMPSA